MASSQEWLFLVNDLFQSLKGFQRFCGLVNTSVVSSGVKFQSLKGFQRFCGPSAQRIIFRNALFQSLKGFQRFCGLQI